MVDEKTIKTQSLRQCLTAFKGAGDGSETDKIARLDREFLLLAQKMLYGGYLKVGDDYEIYITDVEFYYHEETPGPNQVKDPIVYHRNGRFPERKLPPFPLMTLHSHWSGFDITFEDPDGNYRASALIREYAVYDLRGKDGGGFVKWDTSTIHPEAETDSDGNPIKGEYRLENSTVVDKRSSFLQYYLNGFSLDGTPNRIEWMDFKNPSFGQPSVDYRQNVFSDKKTKTKDPKKWAFRRKDNLSNLRQKD